MKSLVIGASGQVGKCLMRLLGDDAVGTAHRRATGHLVPLDLADAVAVTRFIADLRPDRIFVPGGVTAVDWCETHEAEARRICVDGTVAVREAAEAVGALVVFFSTDYVFSGKSGPYSETDAPDPISAYGRVKLEAEKAAAGGRSTILRTSMVFSDDPDSKNFHNFVRDTLRAGKELKAYSDQTGNPTYAPILARIASILHGTEGMGVFHVAGPEVLSRVEFARRVARAYGFDEGRVKPVTSEEMPMPAARPKQGGLRLGVLQEYMVKQGTVDAALAEMTKTFKPR
jgi:dTDP-4-dehydrorhamnose reductase